MSTSRRPWQRNLMKIPPGMLEKVDRFPEDLCVVGVARRITQHDLEQGVFAHLRMAWRDGAPRFPNVVIPDPGNGRYSKTNVLGKEIKLKDRPKVEKDFDQLRPNFGDWSKGSHIVTQTRLVWQRRFIPPRDLAIRIEQSAEDVRSDALIFTFRVDEVLDRRADDFHDRLLFNLNLLQENVGAHDVVVSDATLADYLGTLNVAWVILPPGTRDETLSRLYAASLQPDPKTRERIAERYDFLRSLKPERLIQGSSGFHRYFGGQFADDLVVFENLDYGNAIYMMFGNWEELSKKSRTELLAQHPDQFVRNRHVGQWQERVRARLALEREKRRQGGGS